MDAEMGEELQFHLEMETKKNLEAGMEPAEARRQARIAFGGVDRFEEKTREERGVMPVEDLARDLRFAFRNLRKSPVVVFVIVLSLGFRGEILHDPRLPLLRRLAWVWSAQNFLLAAAVFNPEYID